MRVLHINAGNLYGGIETLLLTLARQRGLCPGVEPHFALFFQGRLSEELVGTGVPVHLLGSVRVSHPWTVWLARRRLRRLLAEQRFDLVVTHGCWNHALAAPEARWRGLPVVFWGHMIESGQHWVRRWASWSPPDLVLANSHATSDSVRANLFPTARSEVMYLPVDPPAPSMKVTLRREVREEMSTPDETAVVITVSRLEPLKGHAVFVEALGRLAGLAGWECWVVGGGQRPAEHRYLEQLKSRAEELGIASRVRFLGHRPDARHLLAAADVYCQSNTGPESFGIALVEALYAGLPVVTSAIGAALEILDDSCGVLVPPRNPKRLAGCLARLITSAEERARLGSGGPARASMLCDPTARIKDMERVFRETLSRGPALD